MIGRMLMGCLLAGALGCTAPALSTRLAQDDASLTLRLETYEEGSKTSTVKFDHPMDWAEADLRALLNRLLLQQQVGLLQKAPPPVPVFSPEESARLAPALRKAFQMARPSEWIVFVMRGSGGEGPTLTSGGLFVQDRHLHILLANHRAPAPYRQDVEAIEANPLRPLERRGQALAFDGRPYMVSEQESWMGGRRYPPASELVLDHEAFLAASRPAVQLAPPAPPVQSERRDATDVAELQGQMARLQEENGRLKRLLAEQALEIDRLKARAAEEGRPRKRPTKKPAP